jgi:hypothetical protein
LKNRIGVSFEPSCVKPLAADLVALVARVVERQRRVVEEEVVVAEAERADLGVEVAQVGDLEGLRELGGDDPAVRAEEAGVGHAGPGVALAVDRVAPGAREHLAERERLVVHEEVLARLLARRQRVVELADRVRRVHHLQLEVGERLHLRRGQRLVAPEQALERAVERVERGDLAERPAVRLDVGALALAVAIAAPVHRAVVVEAAQALGRHRPLHRVKVGLADAELRAADVGRRRRHVAVGVAEVPRRARPCRRRCGSWRTTESPWLDVSAASYRKRRPALSEAGSGLCIVTWSISSRQSVSIIEMPLSKRVIT